MLNFKNMSLVELKFEKVYMIAKNVESLLG